MHFVARSCRVAPTRAMPASLPVSIKSVLFQNLTRPGDLGRLFCPDQRRQTGGAWKGPKKLVDNTQGGTAAPKLAPKTPVYRSKFCVCRGDFFRVGRLSRRGLRYSNRRRLISQRVGPISHRYVGPTVDLRHITGWDL